MLWILTAVASVATITALIGMVLAKRGVSVDELGTVSNRWIVEHHVDTR
jgi:hypothetical protein